MRITELRKESHHPRSQKKNRNMSQGSQGDKQDRPGGLTRGLQSCLISAGLALVHLPLLHAYTELPEGCQAPSTACPGKPAPDWSTAHKYVTDIFNSHKTLTISLKIPS